MSLNWNLLQTHYITFTTDTFADSAHLPNPQRKVMNIFKIKAIIASFKHATKFYKSFKNETKLTSL